MEITLRDVINAYERGSSVEKLKFRRLVKWVDEDECDHSSMGELHTVVRPGLLRCFDCGLVYEPQPELQGQD